jgi:hypothetical protein
MIEQKDDHGELGFWHRFSIKYNTEEIRQLMTLCDKRLSSRDKSWMIIRMHTCITRKLGSTRKKSFDYSTIQLFNYTTRVFNYSTIQLFNSNIQLFNF